MGDTASSSSALDWSQLPPDLLVSVLSLLEIRDLFACAAVSLRWRAACSAARQLGLWPDQGPYLIHSSADRDAATATLHNISTGRSFHAALPDNTPFRNRYIVGSSHGWLVTADEQSNLHLFNPVTGAQVALPPPESMVGVRASFNRHGELSGHYTHYLDLMGPRVNEQRAPQFWRPNKTRKFLYQKVILSSHPSSGDCMAVLIHKHISFARIGDTKWTWLDAVDRCDWYDGIFYNDGDRFFYATRGNGEIHTIDLNGPSPVVKVIFKVESLLCEFKNYIVPAPWGDLLRVQRQYPDPLLVSSDSDDGYQSSNPELEDNSLDEVHKFISSSSSNSKKCQI